MIVMHFSKQKEAILEHTNAKCHLCTLWSPHNTIECTHVIILISAFDDQVL